MTPLQKDFLMEIHERGIHVFNNDGSSSYMWPPQKPNLNWEIQKTTVESYPIDDTQNKSTRITITFSVPNQTTPKVIINTQTGICTIYTANIPLKYQSDLIQKINQNPKIYATVIEALMHKNMSTRKNNLKLKIEA